ncbi:MAG: DUF4270 domain-containing protein [Prevotella sp.]|nr:DUF4270 domain-containing protein [Prevotella sp.]
MKTKLFGLVMILANALAACDSTTDTLGNSLTEDIDQLIISTDTFAVETRSIAAKSVLGRNTIGHIGRMKDPETGALVTSDFMTQFHTIDNYKFPEADEIVSKKDGAIIADSCEIRLFYETFSGDSLATMTLTAYEMDKPMLEDKPYYSDFDLGKEGFLREDGIQQNKNYTLYDKTVADSVRSQQNYIPYIRIPLNKAYTDKNGKRYHNYGTYIMHKYLENPAFFKDSYAFMSNVCPGFFFKSTAGIGSMANISMSHLVIYYRIKENDSIYNAVTTFAGTDEVLQTTHVSNNQNALQQMIDDDSRTYIKSPAGIFTEISLPIEEIMENHAGEKVNAAKISFKRLNNTLISAHKFPPASTILMLPVDSMYTFFEKKNIADNKTSFVATLSATDNTYTFNNISTLIAHLYNKKKNGENCSENWNKVVLVPVVATYTTIQSNGLSVKILNKVTHDMGISSTSLVGGKNNPNGEVNLSVIYTKYAER